MESNFEKAIDLIDKANQNDPNKETYQGIVYPKELLYSQRMTACLNRYSSSASAALKIATRAQHICRWQIPRNTFPMTKVGYHRWRTELKKHHASLTTDILSSLGYTTDFTDQVSDLIQKKHISKNSEAQILEDVVCLVFIEYYLQDFASQHSTEKIKSILKKTWKKMSTKGQQAALNIDLPDQLSTTIAEALA